MFLARKFCKTRNLLFLCALLICFMLIYLSRNWTPYYPSPVKRSKPPKSSEPPYVPISFNATFSNVSYKYHLLTKPRPDLCHNKSFFAYIVTRPSSFEMRQAIRSTWAHPDNWTHASFFFAMGDPRNVEISKKLEAENEDYGDLIITDLVDSYKNLTFKVYAGLDWFNRFCSEVQFFMKIDDDVALHVERLVHFVNTKFQRSPNQTVYCAFGDVVVIRNNSSKWYVPPELYAPSTYPNFCIGATYMISAEAAKVIGEKTPEHPFLYIDDVFYTGIVAEAAGIPRVNEAQIFFNWDAIKDVTCDKGGVPYLATMYEFKTPEALFKAYYTLQGIKCGPWWRALLG